MAEEKLSAEKVADLALLAVNQYVSKEAETVISVEEAYGEWCVTVEVLERRAVPDTQDLLGRYAVKLNMRGELIGWRQVMVRKRSDRMMPAEEGWIVIG